MRYPYPTRYRDTPHKIERDRRHQNAQPQGWTLIQYRLYEFAALTPTRSAQQPVMPDDHSKLVPLLPIPNRTVKRLRADDSADPCVKVGHRQAVMPETPSLRDSRDGVCLLLSRALAPGRR